MPSLSESSDSPSLPLPFCPPRSFDFCRVPLLRSIETNAPSTLLLGLIKSCKGGKIHFDPSSHGRKNLLADPQRRQREGRKRDFIEREKGFGVGEIRTRLAFDLPRNLFRLPGGVERGQTKSGEKKEDFLPEIENGLCLFNLPLPILAWFCCWLASGPGPHTHNGATRTVALTLFPPFH